MIEMTDDEPHGHFHVHDYEHVHEHEHEEQQGLLFFKSVGRGVVHLVRHSHWDYSWFRRRPSSQMREVQTMNDIIKSALRYTFEQTATFKEYLESVVPGKKEKEEFTRLAREGVFELTPFYIQQETFLSGEEDFFRNIEHGLRHIKEIGATPSSAIYIPDTFGQPETLVAMLNAAGYDNVIVERGLDKKLQESGAVIRWQYKGSEVLLIPMQNGYSNASHLTHGFEENGHFMEPHHHSDWEQPENWSRLKRKAAAHAIRSFFGRYGSRYENIDAPLVLMGNGNDFSKLDHELQPILQDLQAEWHGTDEQPGEFPGIEFQFGSYEDYVRLIKENVDMDKLPVYSGELRSGAERNVLRGIDSARIPLKQMLHDVEAKVSVAESLTAQLVLARKYGGEHGYSLDNVIHDTSDQIKAIQQAIDSILPVLSHDAISGCGTDDVYSFMESRLEDAKDRAEQVIRNSLQALQNGEDGYGVHRDYHRNISAVNTLPYARRSVVEFPLVGDLYHDQQLTGVIVVDDEETDYVPVQIIERDDGRYGVAVVDVDGLSSAHVRLKPADAAPFAAPEKQENRRSIENEFYAVNVRPDGSVQITDKQTGGVMGGLVFEECGDAGDEYNFSPTEDHQTLFTTGGTSKVSHVSDGPAFTEMLIDTKLIVPAGLDSYPSKTRSSETVELDITTNVRLLKGVDRIEFSTTVNNTARDHRLRVRFDTPNAGDTIKAKEPYGMTERSAVPIIGTPDWQEPGPIATSHTQGLLMAGDLAFMGKGLPEYEAVTGEDGNIEQVALTLIRGVQFLSRDDLETRRGGAGPGVQTPGAQIVGEHTFDYAISLRGNRKNSDAIRQANDYVHQFEHAPSHTLRFVGQDGKLQRSILSIDGDAVKSTLRPTDDGNAVLARFYNPDDEPAVVTLGGIFKNAVRAHTITGEPLDDTDTRNLVVKPSEIVTIRLS